MTGRYQAKSHFTDPGRKAGVRSLRIFPALRAAMDEAGIPSVAALRDAIQDSSLSYNSFHDAAHGKRVADDSGHDYNQTCYAIAIFLRRPMEELFGELPPPEEEISVADMAAYAAAVNGEDFLTQPEAACYHQEIKDYLLPAVDALAWGNNRRTPAIMRALYGLDGVEEETQESLAQRFSVSNTRIVQIDERARKKLVRELWFLSRNALTPLAP